ncbi:MAG: NapC/NirT family cytochrome c, partial [Bacteroidales bacterium]
MAILVTGIFFGFALYAFYLSRAWSYASDRPEVCINCHVMSTEYLTWLHSSHARQVCNDCHVPHENILKKYFFKAK